MCVNVYMVVYVLCGWYLCVDAYMHIHTSTYVSMIKKYVNVYVYTCTCVSVCVDIFLYVCKIASM